MSQSSDPPPLYEKTALPDNWRYEATVAEVEQIIRQIEAGQLDLAEVFEQFTQAVTYLRECETFLSDRQAQLDLLIEHLGNDPE